MYEQWKSDLDVLNEASEGIFNLSKNTKLTGLIVAFSISFLFSMGVFVQCSSSNLQKLLKGAFMNEYPAAIWFQ